MDCLTRLGRDMQIVVKAAPRSRGSGRLSAVDRIRLSEAWKVVWSHSLPNMRWS